MSTSDLPRLLAVFLVVFDNLQGGKVAYEVPEGSVAGSYPAASVYEPSPLPPGSSLLSVAAHTAAHRDNAARASANEPLFELSSVLQYILPRRPVMRHLVTICVENCKILGFPVLVENQEYSRGQFMYNVCFAFERNAELTSYEPVVRKTGRILQHMEETSFFLSDPANELRLHSILEQLYEDLGSYSEASIPLDEANTLDLKLFPQNPNPATIRDWDIPVSMIAIEDVKDESWDITMYTLAGLIDATRTVKQIANMADVDLSLAREAMQHLLFYGCIILHDLFQFTNAYTLVAGSLTLSDLLQDDATSRAMQTECERYVSLTSPVTPFATLFRYYAELRSSTPLEEWIEKLKIDTEAIDVRRLISFGIIKGFLRRVEVYPVWLDHPSFAEAEATLAASHTNSLAHKRGRTTNARPISGRSGLSSLADSLETLGTAKQSATADASAQVSAREAASRPATESDTPAAGQSNGQDNMHTRGYPASLPALLDGEHTSDELCVRYRVNFRQLREFLKMIGGATTQPETPAPGKHRPNVTTASGIVSSRSQTELGRVVLVYV